MDISKTSGTQLQQNNKTGNLCMILDTLHVAHGAVLVKKKPFDQRKNADETVLR